MDSKLKELRKLLYGDKPHLEEPGFDPEKPYNYEEDKQKIVVETLYRKAMTEHTYTKFYAEVTTKLIRMELL